MVEIRFNINNLIRFVNDERTLLEITENTPLEELLIKCPGAMKVLARHGMHSIACPAELIEPLYRVAEAREMPIEQLISELRQFVETQDTDELD